MGRNAAAGRKGGPRDADPDETGPDLDPAWVARVRQGLSTWYEGARRDLPWRQDRDPYRILISEVMLVQTTVTAVIPFYERFLAQFPTVKALAAADEAEVLKAWEGLGYYRRARQLHAAAKEIVSRHGGVIPNDVEAVRALPGVGRYIAGAILSFAFDVSAPIVEANTQRVLARWLAWPEDVATSRSQARLWKAAGRLVPPKAAGQFNQAFMELGALLCVPRVPLCLLCPVASDCQARMLGLQGALPKIAPKPAPLTVHEACALVRDREGQILIVRRGPGVLWEGFWEFPTIHLAGADPAKRSFREGGPVDLAEGVRHLTGVRPRIGEVVHTVRFSVTRHRVTLDVYKGLAEGGVVRAGPGLVDAAWVPVDSLRNYPFGTAARRLIGWIARYPLGPE